MSLARTRSLRILVGLVRKARAEFSRMSAILKYLQEHPEVLRGYISYARKLGILRFLRRVVEIVKRGGLRQAPMPTTTTPKFLLRSTSGQPVVILTTPHCLYVAHAISTALSRVGIETRIIDDHPHHGYNDDLYFVI